MIDQLQRHRVLIEQLAVYGNPNIKVSVTLGELTALVNKIDELEAALEDAGERMAGEDA